jgi:hypothetical protein
MHYVLAGHAESGAVPGLVALVSRKGALHVDVIGSMSIGGPPMRHRRPESYREDAYVRRRPLNSPWFCKSGTAAIPPWCGSSSAGTTPCRRTSGTCRRSPWGAPRASSSCGARDARPQRGPSQLRAYVPQLRVEALAEGGSEVLRAAAIASWPNGCPCFWPSVLEVALAGHHHRDPRRIRRRDDVGVLHRAAGLNDRGHAGPEAFLQTI